MTNESTKYKAYTYNVGGFALMSPAGRLVLDAINVFQDFKPSAFIIAYLVLCLILMALGYLCIVIGHDILEKN